MMLNGDKCSGEPEQKVRGAEVAEERGTIIHYR